MTRHVFSKIICLLLLSMLISEPAIAEKQKRLAAERQIKAQFEYSFNDVSDKLVIISCKGSKGSSAGSGFVADMEGKTYLFTNQHVILGADKISFKTATGEILRPRSVELSSTRDIARLWLGEEINGFAVTAETSIGAPIAVFGNSEGGGVATELYGEVTTLSADVVDVTADFVFGNSGSPVLNLDQEVIGIATAVQTADEDDEDDKDERSRHFCYRLTGSQWMPVNWNRYNGKYGKLLLEKGELIDSIYSIASLWYSEPYTRMTFDDHPDADLRKWSKEHNRTIDRIMRLADKGVATPSQLDTTNKRIKQDMQDSAEALADVCQKRARQMRMISGQRDMTDFLRGKFEGFAARLEYAAVQIDEYGEKLAKHDYFTFK